MTTKSPKRRIAKTGFPDFGNAREFEALSDADKEKVFDYYTTHPTLKGLRPIDAAERKLLAAERKKIGRPIAGEASATVAVSIERGLLQQADAYAKAHGLKRTQLIAKGLRLAMGNG
ncbi:MAG TPA: hypothetical protein VFC46_07925 [Humisphaera sp.]|nr:hypothetical protein [Humisphaera sp.]